MRPLTLELEGFTAFKQPTRVDFSDLDLFAITGPTGAGKSSLIDAVCYALYGRVPRVNNEVGSCISQGLDRMYVSLEFLAGEGRFRVFRETRRKGQGNIRLERWEGDDWLPLADRVREVNEQVEKLVGLDFDGFIRSVLLPQGQFQEFLAGKPESRRDVLRRLLRLEIYDRMRVRAQELAREAKQKVDFIEGELRERLADATPETLAGRRRDLDQAQRDATGHAHAVEALAATLRLATTWAEAQDERSRREAAVLNAKKRLAEAEALVSAGDEATERFLKQRESLRAELEANAFNEDLFAALTSAANTALDISNVEKALAQAAAEEKTLQKTLDAGRKDETAAAKAAEKAAAEVVAADAALTEARRHDLAAALRTGLKPGDACPVCGGKVGTLVAFAPAELDAATARLAEAKAAHQKLTDAVRKSGQTVVVAEANLEATGKRVAELTERLAAQRALLAETLPGIEDRSLATVQSMLRLQREAREERARLQKDEAAVSKEIDEAKSRLEAARTELDGLKSRIATETEAADTARIAATAAGRDLEKVAVELEWPELARAVETATDPRPAIEGRQRQARAAHETAMRSVGAIETTIEQLLRDIERANELRAGLSEHKEEHALAADLAGLLRADRFQAYIQAEALRELAKDGSRRLEELSNGRYELCVTDGGQDFEVIDHWNAEDRRSVRTLSGGETFLASLALALSLAESLPLLAPGRAVSLDSIFLDEGFGALDPEALNLAANALDSLSVEGRLICVVTHLPELAERLPARLEVRKSESGSRVEVA